jgi:putative membrane protein insertion efficiency factor/ribonuclease P protein component
VARQSFPKTLRVRQQADFDRAYQARLFAADDVLVVNACPTDLPHPRLGLSVSKKVGNAVARNRWKRLIREAFRLLQAELPGGVDLIVRPQSSVRSWNWRGALPARSNGRGPIDPAAARRRPLREDKTPMLLLRTLAQLPAWTVIGLVRVYQWTLSPIFGRQCRFEPTCSHYMIGAVEKYGVVRGVLKGLWRILRCNPFCQGGHDPP